MNRAFPRHAFPVAALASALLLGACGGGGGDDPAPAGGPAEPDAATVEVGPFADGTDPDGADAPTPGTPVPDASAPDVPVPGALPSAPPASAPAALDPLTGAASYRVTLENFWGAEDFPQGFPDGAHLSLIGGALHDASVSFWEPGRAVSPGMEDIAETGMIDVFLFDEVMPAIAAGDAGGLVEVREFTGPMVDGVPGRKTFDIDVDSRWPLLTLATMLGPSPDWFVGVHGLPLDTDAGWVERLSVDLPLYDGGTKSDIQPVMGGPDIIPGVPVALVAYDDATGTYLPTDVPQVVARLSLERVR